MLTLCFRQIIYHLLLDLNTNLFIKIQGCEDYIQFIKLTNHSSLWLKQSNMINVLKETSNKNYNFIFFSSSVSNDFASGRVHGHALSHQKYRTSRFESVGVEYFIKNSPTVTEIKFTVVVDAEFLNSGRFTLGEKKKKGVRNKETRWNVACIWLFYDIAQTNKWGCIKYYIAQQGFHVASIRR